MPKAEVLNNCCEGTGDGRPIGTLAKADTSSQLSSEHWAFGIGYGNLDGKTFSTEKIRSRYFHCILAYRIKRVFWLMHDACCSDHFYTVYLGFLNTFLTVILQVR